MNISLLSPLHLPSMTSTFALTDLNPEQNADFLENVSPILGSEYLHHLDVGRLRTLVVVDLHLTCLYVDVATEERHGAGSMNETELIL